jgi:phosphoribosyl 1,2-cyclic phosphate phosphodiesterase
MTITITILGCGSSGGVPRVGQGWGACDPTNPRNRRRRCSILVQREGAGGVTNVLVDTSPDLREQLLDLDITRLDGVLITHDHADHTHGFDDLRPLVGHNRRRVDVWIDPTTCPDLRARFSYAFETPANSEYPPIVNEHRIEPGVPFAVDGPGGPVDVVAFRLIHGGVEALGFRFGAVAYTPDVNIVPDDCLGYLRGLDLWIIDALRETPHPSHFTLAEALGWIERLKPKQAVLTNLHTDLDYDALSRSMPRNVEPAFDGMVLKRSGQR